MKNKEWKKRIKKLEATFQLHKMVDHLNDLVTEEAEVESWPDFQKWFKQFGGGWIFRGQRVFSWPLLSSFDRAVYQSYDYKNGSTTMPISPVENEEMLLSEFRKTAHLYHNDVPGREESDIHDWFALMQHHGCPTRFLDWTYSPYVALYFAVCDQSNEDGAIWALNIDWAERASVKINEDWNSLKPEEREHRQKYPVLVRASLNRRNERLVTQRGELLSTSEYNIPIVPTMLSMILHDGGRARENCMLSRIRIKKERRLEFLWELNRMNIHHASLFPGPDGFSRSLAMSLELKIDSQIKELVADSNEFYELHIRRNAGS